MNSSLNRLSSASAPAQIPPVSRRHAPKFANDQHRETNARTFDSGGAIYHDVRPDYPAQILATVKSAHRVLDVGAGTGKLTQQLVAAPDVTSVYALDPSHDMLSVLRHQCAVPAWRARAENTAAGSQLFDVITCAQTWHWVDTVAACREFDRISTDDARVLLVWNTLDVAVAWVHRLTRIMHAGDTLAEGFVPQIHPPWQIETTIRLRWEQTLTPEEIQLLSHTRSYWLKSSSAIRETITTNLRWYLYDHLGFSPHQPVRLPYRCDGFVLTKATR